jgi:starvation-inducible DNA-binding protein
MTLHDLYKKSHCQVAGPTFYQLHLLFDKHFNEQGELVRPSFVKLENWHGAP